MEMERTVAHRPIAHRHKCCDCGERWGCLDKCLAGCGCLGRPYCMHYRCHACRSIAGDEVFAQPVVGRDGGP